VDVPTLPAPCLITFERRPLIVGGVDFTVIELNKRAFARLRGPKALEIVPGASHLFPEPGTLKAVIGHAQIGSNATSAPLYLTEPA